MSEELEYRIAKLEVKPGDVVVFKVDRPLTSEAVHHFQIAARACLPPGVKAVLLEGDVDLSVLTAAEIDRRSAA